MRYCIKNSKPLNVESRKQRLTIAQGLEFSGAKNLGQIPTCLRQLGRQIEVG